MKLLSNLLIFVLSLGLVDYASTVYPRTILVSWRNHICSGGDLAFVNTSVILRYNYSEYVSVEQPIVRILLTRNISGNLTYNLNYPNEFIEFGSQDITAQYSLIQAEHGGGECNCLDVFFPDAITGVYSERYSICGNSASVPRKKVIDWHVMHGYAEMIPFPSRNLLNNQLNCNGKRNESLHVVATFQIIFENYHEYQTVNDFNEGVEFSFRFSSTPDEWIPVKFIYLNTSQEDNDIYIGNRSNLIIRGYHVDQQKAVGSDNESSVANVVVEMCGIDFSKSVQFRWLQTSHSENEIFPSDTWILDNLIIYNAINGTICQPVLTETFNEELNSSIWPETHVRNAAVLNYSNCRTGLLFGLQNGGEHNTITSRILLTKYYNFSTSRCINSYDLSSFNAHSSADMCPHTLKTTSTSVVDIVDEHSTSIPLEPSAEHSTSIPLEPSAEHSKSIPLEPSASSEVIVGDIYVLEKEEERVKNEVMLDQNFNQTLKSENINEIVLLLRNVTDLAKFDPLMSIYRYYLIIQRLTAVSFSDSNLEAIVEAGYAILQSKNQEDIISRIVGSTVLLIFDQLMFNYVPSDKLFSTSNIVLHTMNISRRSTNSEILAIGDSYENASAPSLSLPSELIAKFYENNFVTVASAQYNVSEIPPNTFLSNFSSSYIVASSLQCGSGRCPTSNLTLYHANVSIIFPHSLSVQEILGENKMEIKCVFLDILSSPTSILKIGQWSDRGCYKNSVLSSMYRTVCQCNHLTHFAILLSPKPPVYPRTITLSLTWIGYVGVGVSLVCMLMTITIFTYLNFHWKKRPLLVIRNYIHINLCISLIIAQVTFVSGIDKTGTSLIHPPTHCQLIAVLLHYFFLCSFMWMLMEGVALYVALVRVFDTHSVKYMVGYTLVGYGVPLLYMCLLTIPLGLKLSDGPHYGSRKYCFLNFETNFIWAMIAPVIIILLANIGFFIMASRISWQQNMKKVERNKSIHFLNWLKSSISLAVILGLTQLMGLLVIDVKELLPLAYIYTIFMAFQGLLIFLVLVVFSRPVQDQGKKWWRRRMNMQTSRVLLSSSSRTNTHLHKMPSKTFDMTLDSIEAEFTESIAKTDLEQDVIKSAEDK